LGRQEAKKGKEIMKVTSFQVFYLPAALLLLCSAASFAQEKERPNENSTKPADTVVLFGPESSVTAGPSSFHRTEFSFEKLVKGAPYSGQAVTQTTQTLSDGNRITSENSVAVYRDSKGRTRREIFAGGASAGAQPERITINDPSTGDAYDLDPATRTATRNRVMRLAMAVEAAARDREGAAGPGGFGEIAVSSGSGPGQLQNFGFVRVAPDKIKLAPAEEKPSADGGPIVPRNESLGTRTMEGVEARGSRTTMTIPAGKIGNERAIEIVHESWYSPELQTIVMSRIFDPRSGEVLYRLTNINRAEPDSSLFELPGDYKVQQDSGDTFSLTPLVDKLKATHRTRSAKPPEPEP
jgi:hypothetical protein